MSKVISALATQFGTQLVAIEDISGLGMWLRIEGLLFHPRIPTTEVKEILCRAKVSSVVGTETPHQDLFDGAMSILNPYSHWSPFSPSSPSYPHPDLGEGKKLFFLIKHQPTFLIVCHFC
jgi:hypothetical protein